jgi:sporulation protein YlmC with PRC-barrel domain/ribosomal protein L40E
MSQKRYIRKEDIVSKLVINQEGNEVGSVRDTAFDIEGKLALIVGKNGNAGEMKNAGAEEYISINEIKSFGDYIILKDGAPSKQPEREHEARTSPIDRKICPNPKCGWRNDPKVGFCIKCGTKID